MSNYRLSPSGGPAGPWFSLGRLEVTTVVLVVAVTVMSWLAWAVESSLPRVLYFDLSLVAQGELWRVLTWPLAEPLSLWSVLTLFFFWYFGRELEQLIGRVRMLWLLLGVVAALTLSATVVGAIFAEAGVLAGLSAIEFVVLLLWIAEYPNRTFWFGIPAWVFGVVLVAVNILMMIGTRGWGSLLSLMLGLVLSALVARAAGLLGGYAWIPGPGAGPRRPRPSRAARRPDRRRESDRERLDALLDRINEVGINALSDRERRELKALRDRLRGGR